MTPKQKLQAEELRRNIIIEQGNKCFVCGKGFSFNNLPQISHRIPKYKRYIDKYGAEVIHHRLNLRACCDVCNVKVSINPCSQPIKAAELIELIKADIVSNK